MESERQYDSSRFNNHVCSDFSFEDHNPATIKMILAFCQHAERQLKEMPDRTLVIHCKAGKVCLNYVSIVFYSKEKEIFMLRFVRLSFSIMSFVIQLKTT